MKAVMFNPTSGLGDETHHSIGNQRAVIRAATKSDVPHAHQRHNREQDRGVSTRLRLDYLGDQNHLPQLTKAWASEAEGPGSQPVDSRAVNSPESMAEARPSDHHETPAGSAQNEGPSLVLHVRYTCAGHLGLGASVTSCPGFAEHLAVPVDDGTRRCVLGKVRATET